MDYSTPANYDDLGIALGRDHYRFYCPYCDYHKV